MKKIRFAELSESVQLFLDQIQRGEGIVVEDERGCARYGVIPYNEGTVFEQESAWQRIERVQKKVTQSLQMQNLSEADINQLLQEKE